mmetsp:Transcript_86915/g.241932  ORF Transcript_86915/g.241932 Transcript_86915/m.241932 type:complete len:240 (-) Transcript_86915:121-840(-)
MSCGSGAMERAKLLPPGQPVGQQITFRMQVAFNFRTTARKSMWLWILVSPLCANDSNSTSTAYGCLKNFAKEPVYMPGWRVALALSMMKPMASRLETGAATMRPAGTPGPSTYIGTRTEPSQGRCLPNQWCSPSCSPWSAMTTTRVFDSGRKASVDSSRRPMIRSKFSISAAYWRRTCRCSSGESLSLSKAGGNCRPSTDLFMASVRIKGGCGPGNDRCRIHGLPSGTWPSNSAARAAT